MSLPGADELFRTTGGMALQSTPRQHNGEAGQPAAERLRSVPASAGEGGSPTDPAEPRNQDGQGARAGEHSGRGGGPGQQSAVPAPGPQPGPPAAPAPSRRRRTTNRRPSGRERHDEKITVYVSAEELMDLEHARLVLRGEHGLAVDRGRIVREAVAVVLADLESRGDASILVRRLRGR
ncbi:hypothetical protein AQ490_20310 [Wenjunlia vitaminophila]|uniref:Cobyrinic acid a,c-diamide synthase n=1 Tax=Wenjunlia vitaminophila TaxID=76728 RepID=A0A0T6LUH7_WENVI|nr:hypothetical protein AQ490_20310 [Wenjunlia vitaminophila]